MNRNISPKVDQLFKQCIGMSPVHVGSAGEFLLVAAMMHEGKAIKVHSDKGFEHLLLLLCKEVAVDTVEIDKELSSIKYLYPLSFAAVNSVEKVLASTYATIVLSKEGYGVTLKSVAVPALDALPGVYAKLVKGWCIESAFLKSKNIPFTLRQ